MSHHHLLIDTCVWLNLAIDPAAADIVSLLEQLVSAKSFTLVVPKIIEDEFDRHKSQCAARLGTKLSDRVKETLKFVKDFGEPKDKSILLPALESFLTRKK